MIYQASLTAHRNFRNICSCVSEIRSKEMCKCSGNYFCTPLYTARWRCWGQRRVTKCLPLNLDRASWLSDLCIRSWALLSAHLVNTLESHSKIVINKYVSLMFVDSIHHVCFVFSFCWKYISMYVWTFPFIHVSDIFGSVVSCSLCAYSPPIVSNQIFSFDALFMWRAFPFRRLLSMLWIASVSFE